VIAQQHRERRRVDARMRIVRDGIRLQVLLTCTHSEFPRAIAFRGTVERILQKPPAQAGNVRSEPGRRILCFGAVEQRVRDSRCTGTGMRERAPVQQFTGVRLSGDGFAEGVARIPRRAAIEMRANDVDIRAQDGCASAMSARRRRTLIMARICGGNASISDAASRRSAALCRDPASADA